MNSIEKYLARILKKKEKTQIKTIIYDRGIITTDNHSSTRDYERLLKQLYTNKLDNLEEMDKLLETYLPRLNHEETDNLNRPTTSKVVVLWGDFWLLIQTKTIWLHW